MICREIKKSDVAGWQLNAAGQFCHGGKHGDFYAPPAQLFIRNPRRAKQGLSHERGASLFKRCKIDIYGTVEEFRKASRDLLNSP
jgi:hypothetical protein